MKNYWWAQLAFEEHKLHSPIHMQLTTMSILNDSFNKTWYHRLPVWISLNNLSLNSPCRSTVTARTFFFFNAVLFVSSTVRTIKSKIMHQLLTSRRRLWRLHFLFLPSVECALFYVLTNSRQDKLVDDLFSCCVSDDHCNFLQQ